jgi:hypothetical protein
MLQSHISLFTVALFAATFVGCAPTQVQATFKLTDRLVTTSPDFQPVESALGFKPYAMVQDQAGDLIIGGHLAGDTGDDEQLRDAFIVRTSVSGNMAWKIRFGTNEEDRILSVGVDKKGNIYAAGYTSGSFDAAPNAGKEDAFVLKLDSNGNFIWLRQFGTPEYEGINNVLIDSEDNVILVGDTRGWIANQNRFLDSYDIFVMKMEPNGSIKWSNQSERLDFDIHRGAVLDESNNIIVAGQTNISRSGDQAGLLLKFKPDGTIAWSHQITPNGPAMVFRWLNLDSRGNLIAPSEHRGPYGQFNNDGGYAVVSKFDRSGNPIWAAGLIGSDRYSPYIYSQTIDNNDNVYTVGSTRDSLNGRGSNTTQYSQAFVASFDNTGNRRWLRRYSEPNNNLQALCAVTIRNGNVIVLIDNWTTGTWKLLELNSFGETLNP